MGYNHLEVVFQPRMDYYLSFFIADFRKIDF